MVTWVIGSEDSGFGFLRPTNLRRAGAAVEEGGAAVRLEVTLAIFFSFDLVQFVRKRIKKNKSLIYLLLMGKNESN